MADSHTVRTKLPDVVSKRATGKTARDRKASRTIDVSQKTFEDLTNPEKDALLKELFIRMGLIQDSD